ncbi:MAG TPA: helix-hairpin-helix domain-containing protein, partial [Arthrobacter sp.]|nr:helix-hairpin-helix domain-containing protein [Arthrobacter sp.]
NTASPALLSRVAGVGPLLSENIVAYRNEHGPFHKRSELKKVPRLGAKAFEQCAGFLRITGGAEPLDASSVHPEAYPVARRIRAAAGGKGPAAGSYATLNPQDFVDGSFGLPTVQDIIAELEKPGRDPRPAFAAATFSEGIEKISDLRPGMVLEGTVTNVAAFGAFVDVGVHQDGLVHVSALANRFVADPHDVVKSGQVVRVKVLEADPERKRISLTLRLDDEPAAAGGRAAQQPDRSRPAAPQAAQRQPGQGPASRQPASKQPASKQPAGKPAPGRQPQGAPRAPAKPAPANTAMAEALRKAGLGK